MLRWFYELQELRGTLTKTAVLLQAGGGEGGFNCLSSNTQTVLLSPAKLIV